MKNPFNIKTMAKENRSFRRVVETGKYGQLVVMSVRKGEDIGEEVHSTTDQLFYVVDGKGELRMDGKMYPLDEHFVMLVPAGTRHDIRNTGTEDLKLFTMYAPPMHREGLVVETRGEALAGAKH